MAVKEKPKLTPGPSFAPVVSSVIPGAPPFAGAYNGADIYADPNSPAPGQDFGDWLQSLLKPPAAPDPTIPVQDASAVGVPTPGPAPVAAVSPAAPPPAPVMLSQPATAPPPADSGAALYQPQYEALPPRPPMQALPPVPVRDAGKERAQRDQGINTAALLPLLNLIGGGRAAYNASALYNPEAVANTIAGTSAASDADYERAIHLYGLQNQQAQYGNTQAAQQYTTQVAATNAHNTQETEKAKLSRTDAANAAKAGQPLVNALKYLSTIKTPEQRAAVINSGVLSRFGISDDQLAEVERKYPNEKTPEQEQRAATLSDLHQQYTLLAKAPETIKPQAQVAILKQIQADREALGITGAADEDALIEPIFADMTAPQRERIQIARGQLNEHVRNDTANNGISQQNADTRAKLASTAVERQTWYKNNIESLISTRAGKTAGIPAGDQAIMHISLLQAKKRAALDNIAKAKSSQAAFASSTDPFSKAEAAAYQDTIDADTDFVEKTDAAITTLQTKIKQPKNGVQPAQLPGKPLTGPTAPATATPAAGAKQDWLKRFQAALAKKAGGQ